MDNIILDKSCLDMGLIGVNYTGKIPPPKRLKVITALDGFIDYKYNIQRNGLTQYPLTCGNGDYSIKIFEEIADSRYKQIFIDTIDIDLPNPDIVFLQSCVNMEWDRTKPCIQYATGLAMSKHGALDKTNAIWKHMVHTSYKYDKQLAENIKYDYIPDISRTFEAKKDICFGFTALFNSMLRCIGFNAKMVHGTAPGGGYHAWSEVYINKKWVLIDITHDIAKKPAKIPKRNPIEYIAKYYY